MMLRFRLYVRRDDQGLYTVTLPGVPGYVAMDGNTDDYPASPRFSASGTILELVKQQIHEALELWLPWADPEWLESASNYREGQQLVHLTLYVRP